MHVSPKETKNQLEIFVGLLDHLKLTALFSLLKVKPYLPYEYTFEGTLQRIYALHKHQDFCSSKVWPPLRNRKVVVGVKNKSCKDACEEKGEPLIGFDQLIL